MKNLISAGWTFINAGVWLVNGLYCKVLDQVPRHKEIIGKILITMNSRELAICIGVGEIIIAIWIITGWKKAWCAFTQIMLIMTMNIIEFFVVPEWLLWGRWNIVFAALFCLCIFFFFKRSSKLQPNNGSFPSSICS